MLTYSNPNEEIKLTMMFGCYEEVYALQLALIDVLRAAKGSDLREETDASAVLDVLQATLPNSSQVKDFSMKASRKAA